MTDKHEIPLKQLKIPCVSTITRIDNYYLPADQIIFNGEIEEITKDGLLLKATVHFAGYIGLITRFSFAKVPIQTPVDVIWQRRQKGENFMWCEYNDNIDVDTHVRIVQYLLKHSGDLVYK